MAEVNYNSDEAYLRKQVTGQPKLMKELQHL